MDIFEALKMLEENSEKLEKELKIPDLSKPYWEKTNFSEIESPLKKQADILAEIASNTKTLEIQAIELKRIADSAEKSAEFAEAKANSAKYEATKANRKSRINTWIAVAAVIVAVLAWLVPRELVFGAAQNLVHYIAQFTKRLP